MIKCIDKNIIVEETEDDSNARNIIIKSENNNIFGNVISIGSNVLDISVGDKIIFSRNDAKKIIYNNAEFFVLNEKDVLAVIWGEKWKI